MTLPTFTHPAGGLIARGVFALTAALVLAVTCAWSQPSPPQPANPKGTHLGVVPAPVPDVLYDQLEALPRGRGVVVAEVLADSPAARARLRRNDILLTYDSKPIESCEQLVALVAADKPDRKVRLGLLRAGKEQTVDVTLAVGSVIRWDADTGTAYTDDSPRGTVKSANSAKVSVSATPLERGGMSVTIEYYQDGTGKLKTVTFSGSDAQIDSDIGKLPQRVQDLARAALERIRALERHEKN